ncbi:MAG: EAL domain-containing protein [Sulfuricurvum sp.]|uniref:sensor domain-containing protein n=1 Tax=Sulfuricurvum sp. TaxID=2025608 RepID=UPI00262C233C|nr:bifunctional diguanylate cyclase/phosphodiesterase [Sulfuricurvum sp.]MDD2830332.1 EAL domain-containing protein [Sulfuricurvum sp.]MDD4950797.1 EAL domain-containing protein [Sulfuricurvum sp.]
MQTKMYSRSNAFLIAFLYFFIGIFWIYFSDGAVEIIALSTNDLKTLQTYKGFFYVFSTSILLYFLVSRFLNAQFKEYALHLQTLKSKSELEISLHKTNQMYHDLFDNMLDSIAHCRMIYENGIPVDYEYINVNKIFESMTGLHDVIGRKISEFIPEYTQENPDSLRVFGEVASSGKPCKWEHYLKALDQWYNFSIYSPNHGEFIVISANVTSEKKAQIELNRSNALLKTIINSTPDAIFVKDIEGKYLLFNHAASELAGKSEDEAIGNTDEVLFTPEGAKALREMDQTILKEKVIRSQEEQAITLSGDKKVFYSTKGPIYNEDGSLLGIFGISHDITEHKQNEIQLLKQKTMFDNIAEGVYAVDLDDRCNYINFAGLKLLGLSESDILGQFPHDVFHYNIYDGKYYSREECPIQIAVLNGETAYIEHRFHRKDGSVFPVHMSVSPVIFETNIIGSVITFEDITQQQIDQDHILDEKERYDYLAHHDELTSLPNRLSLNEYMNHVVSLNKKIAFMFLDLDGFKEVNDSYGHRFGDKLLIEMTKLFKELFPIDSYIVRTGGDEFVIIVPSEGEHLQIESMMINLANMLDKPFHIDAKDIYITASIGIAFYPKDAKNSEELMRCADSAMYEAKNSGKNTFSIYKSVLTEKAVTRMSILTNLKKALINNELELYYQPQVDPNTREIIGTEALLRWFSPDGMISPSDFIPIAEESGLIIELGKFVLKESCKTAKKWADAGILSGRIAVNVAARQFIHSDFIAILKAIIDDAKCEPEWIEIEITERSILSDPEKVIVILDELRIMGFHVSIDDFGTGYSSLSYLKNLPINKLKIDISFVRNIMSEPKNQTIVKTIIALAKGLEIEVLAEGVETIDEMEFLRDNGIDSIQGYYYHRPMSAKNIEDL